MSDYDCLFKVLILGESGVGKSSILQAYVNNFFSENYISTIGVDFFIKILKHNNTSIKIQIWDTAGQERFRSIVNAYYRGCHAVILVYDCTDIDSFDRLKCWYKEIKNFLTELVPILVISNKNDIRNKKVISTIQGKEYANSISASFVELSANITFKENKIKLDESINNFIIHLYEKDQYLLKDDKKIPKLSSINVLNSNNVSNTNKCDNC